MAWRATRLRDTIDLLRRQLDSLGRGDPGYGTRYDAFSRLNDTLAALQIRAAPLHATLDTVRRRVLPVIDSLRAEGALWEDSTFKEYAEIVRHLSGGRLPMLDTTGPDGTAAFRLPPGPWWIYARSGDAADPNRQWYWNVTVKGDTVLLDPTNGRRVPRY